MYMVIADVNTIFHFLYLTQVILSCLCDFCQVLDFKPRARRCHSRGDGNLVHCWILGSSPRMTTRELCEIQRFRLLVVQACEF